MFEYISAGKVCAVFAPYNISTSSAGSLLVGSDRLLKVVASVVECSIAGLRSVGTMLKRSVVILLKPLSEYPHVLSAKTLLLLASGLINELWLPLSVLSVLSSTLNFRIKCNAICVRRSNRNCCFWQ